jgi:acetoin utilization deacetylase AcuC-like enzyme
VSNRIAFIASPLCLRHRTPPGHPEQPARIEHLLRHIDGSGVADGLERLAPREAREEDLLRVHANVHVDFVRGACANGGGMLDEGDTFAVPDSWGVSLLAAGAVLTGVDAVCRDAFPAAFCGMRPPGHHAERHRPMGFCLFNNAAVGVRYAQEIHGLDRIAVVDWDVHHGNGTQHIFEEDPSVLYCSIHQYPFYPGTGARDERGAGKGVGYTVNVPLPEGSDEKRYAGAFREEVLPALERFRPELLILSAGFDAHRDDPLGGMKLDEGSFAVFTRMVRDVAPVVSVLEGGYNLGALARSVEAHLRALLRRDGPEGGAP